MMAAGIVLAWLATACLLLAWVFRKSVANAWIEPVLRVPVLILESDDWGYGPPEQAAALDRLADALARYRDARGAHPVTTLGVVLGGPDTARMREEGGGAYHRVMLDDPRLVPIGDAIRRGSVRGVFAAQLHGMEHFWPACLMRVASSDERVREWCIEEGFPSTESLPSALQSRWVDGSRLPTEPLPAKEAAAAAAEEVQAFARVFGATPDVVVPPTFVWGDVVEAAWAGAGVGVVVSPGRRNERRDAAGEPVGGTRTHYNGEKGPHGVTYVVRDCYFEPALGHSHRRALADLAAKTALGRPTLLEIHRMNFLGDPGSVRQSIDEVTRLLDLALSAHPTLRFYSTSALARELRERSPLVESGTAARIHYGLRRLARNARLVKLAWITGAILPTACTYIATRPRAFAAT